MVRDSDGDETFDEEELAEGFDEEIEEEVVVDDEEDDDEVFDGDVLEVEGADESGDEVADELAVESPDESDDDVTDDDTDDNTDDEGVVEAESPLVEDDDDLVDDSDIEMALDQVLAETIMRTTVVDDDDDGVEVDPEAVLTETILPKQDDEFRCSSCRLLKKVSQLADADKSLCRDCV